MRAEGLVDRPPFFVHFPDMSPGSTFTRHLLGLLCWFALASVPLGAADKEETLQVGKPRAEEPAKPSEPAKPTEVVPKSSYCLRARDFIKVGVINEADTLIERRINPDGTIDIPFLKQLVPIAGTLAEWLFRADSWFGAGPRWSGYIFLERSAFISARTPANSATTPRDAFSGTRWSSAASCRLEWCLVHMRFLMRITSSCTHFNHLCLTSMQSLWRSILNRSMERLWSRIK